MTAAPSIAVDTAVIKLRLIEKIAQLEDAVIMRELANRLSVDLDTTDVPGIKRTPGVVGGRARIRDKRLPVWLLIDFMLNLGIKKEALLVDYPGLTLDDLSNALTYYKLHKEEIDNDIAENSEEE